MRNQAPIGRGELLKKLVENKIGTRLLFGGDLTRQPYMKGQNFRVSGDLKNTNTVMKDTFWIGVQPMLTQEMMDFSISKIKGFVDVNS